MGPDMVFTVDELDLMQAELLPAREALALVNFTNITAVNVAIAVNAASINAAANAFAGQHIASVQH